MCSVMLRRTLLITYDLRIGENLVSVIILLYQSLSTWYSHYILFIYIYVRIYTFVKVFDEEKNGLLQKSTKLPKYFKLYQTLIAL